MNDVEFFTACMVLPVTRLRILASSLLLGWGSDGGYNWSHGSAILVNLGTIHLRGRRIPGGQGVTEFLTYVTFLAKAFQDICKLVLHLYCLITSQGAVHLVLQD